METIFPKLQYNLKTYSTQIEHGSNNRRENILKKDVAGIYGQAK